MGSKWDCITKGQVPLYAVIAMTALLVFARDCIGINVNKYIFLVIYVAAFSLFDRKRIIALIAFTIPMSYGLPNNYLIVLSCLFLLYKQRETFNCRLLLFPLILSLQEVVSIFWYQTVDVVSEIAYMSTLLLLILVVAERQCDAALFLRMYLLGVAVAIGVVICSTAAVYGFPDTLSGAIRIGGDTDEALSGRGTDIIHLRFNANEIGYHSLVALSCALVLFHRTDTNRLQLLICSLVCILGGFLSVSRTWMMFAAILLIAQLLISFGKYGYLRRGIALVFVLAVFAVAVLSLNPELLDSITKRFELANFATAGGRTPLFEAYNNYFLNAPLWRQLFGVGVVDYKEICGLWNSMHNGFQQVLVCLGIIGAAVFVAYFLYLFWYSVKGQSPSLMNYLPLIAGLCFVQSIQLLNPWPLMMPFMCGFMALRIPQPEKKIGRFYQ